MLKKLFWQNYEDKNKKLNLYTYPEIDWNYTILNTFFFKFTFAKNQKFHKFIWSKNFSSYAYFHKIQQN